MIIASTDLQVVIGVFLFGFLGLVSSLLVLFLDLLFMVIQVETIDVSSLHCLEVILKDHNCQMLIHNKLCI